MKAAWAPSKKKETRTTCPTWNKNNDRILSDEDDDDDDYDEEKDEYLSERSIEVDITRSPRAHFVLVNTKRNQIFNDDDLTRLQTPNDAFPRCARAMSLDYCVTIASLS
jgi:glutathionylspermidine synthase